MTQAPTADGVKPYVVAEPFLTGDQAAGPDREIDLAIARLLRVTVWKRNDDDGGNYETTHWHYTASIDSALSLVPEGWEWTINTFANPAKASAYLINAANEMVRTREQYQATPALALCAAALRARASEPHGKE